MSTASVVLVARGRDDGTLRRRLEALAAFYAPAGLTGTAVAQDGPAVLTIAAIGAPLGDGIALWGAPFGRLAPDAATLLGATDGELRETMPGLGLAVAWDGARARLVTAPAGPLAGYTARSEGLEVWATHAVTAAYLAHGRAAVDPDALPELLAFEFVGSGRSLVAGAAPLPPAHLAELTAAGARERSWWPAHERWKPLAPQDAQAHGEAALADSLRRRTAGLTSAGLCLTAGADSRVFAVALRELGLAVTAVTWGEDGWKDVEGARSIAAALDLRWRNVAHWRDDEEALRLAAAEARWSDGAFGLTGSERVWPAAPAVMVGAAGEVGRAFYYRPLAGGEEPRDAAGLAAALFPEGRLGPAAPEARAQAGSAAVAWAEQAVASGRTGWSALDVLYAEQRVAHWGRGQVPALAADFLAGFASTEVLRALASLPLADRLSDAFHRRYVAARRPDLALPEPAAPTPISAPPRPSLARRLRGRLLAPRPAPPAPPPAADAYLAAFWAARPQSRGWVAEAVLAAPLVRGVLGEPWCAATSAGFLRGERRATQQALLASGPVLLADALRELPQEGSSAERIPAPRPLR